MEPESELIFRNPGITMIWMLTSLAALIILALAVYAGHLLWLLKQQRQAQCHQQKAHQKKLSAYNQNLCQSLEAIAKATQQGQCGLSEAAIRLCVVMGQLQFKSAPDLEQRFPALHGLYAAIRHHPTHDARLQLSNKEIRKLDKERLQHEQEFEQAIVKELEVLLDWQVELSS